MKWMLFSILLLCSFLGRSQTFDPFIFDYDQETNTLTVTYTGCEECRLGSVDAVIRCQCQRSCNPTIEEIKGELTECIDECKELYDENELDFDYCLDACEDSSYRNEKPCIDECGPESKPIRTAVRIRAVLYSSWEKIPDDPRVNFDNRAQSDLFTIFGTDIVNVDFTWKPPAPWPEIHSGNNTCYGIDIDILYSDGTGCHLGFVHWGLCNIVG